MNKKNLFKLTSQLVMRNAFMGILSLGLLTTLGSCNSKEKTESENLYDTETTYEDNSNSDTEESYETETTSSNSVSSDEIDDMLDSYEDYVDQYISYMKKVGKGDMTAMADAPALMEKAEEWGQKMENSKGDMTARQMARMTEILNKMNIAISDMNEGMK